MSVDTTLTIAGNMTADPELAVTPSGVPWARITIAHTPRRYDTQTGAWVDQDAVFIRCVAWRDLAEHIDSSLTKGTRVVASGRLRTNAWQTPEGEKRSTLELILDDIGPSLRWATAKVTRITRHENNVPPPADPWTNNTPAPAATPATATSAPSTASVPPSGAYDEPPF